MQLRSVSAQSATIDDVNAQTKRLASQLEELNQVYARMVEALKVNMTNNTNA
jgi:nitrate reductase assembly molybdenum cofactor insertion protein NarJ